MRDRAIIIHPGLGRCGTKSIQSQLLKYPAQALFNDAKSVSLIDHYFRSRLCAASRYDSNFYIRRITDHLLYLFSVSTRDIIISNESYLDFNPPFFNARVQILGELLVALSSHLPVRVVVTCRSFDSYLKSNLLYFLSHGIPPKYFGIDVDDRCTMIDSLKVFRASLFLLCDTMRAHCIPFEYVDLKDISAGTWYSAFNLRQSTEDSPLPRLNVTPSVGTLLTYHEGSAILYKLFEAFLFPGNRANMIPKMRFYYALSRLLRVPLSLLNSSWSSLILSKTPSLRHLHAKQQLQKIMDFSE